jgi:hypothetical protein
VCSRLRLSERLALADNVALASVVRNESDALAVSVGVTAADFVADAFVYDTVRVAFVRFAIGATGVAVWARRPPAAVAVRV